MKINKKIDNVYHIEFGVDDDRANARIYRYDTGQLIKFYDIPDGVEVQFSSEHSTNGTINKRIEDGMVQIPDSLLTSKDSIIAYIKYIDENSETTTKLIKFGLLDRAKPSDYVSPDEEPSFRSFVEEQLKEAKETVEKNKDYLKETIENTEKSKEYMDAIVNAADAKMTDINTLADAKIKDLDSVSGEKSNDIATLTTAKLGDINNTAQAQIESINIVAQQNIKSGIDAINNAANAQIRGIETVADAQKTGIAQTAQGKIKDINNIATSQIDAINKTAQAQAQAIEKQGNEILEEITGTGSKNAIFTVEDGALCIIQRDESEV